MTQDQSSPPHRRSDVPLDTRALNCADGLTRVIALEPWYWDRLDFLLEVDRPSLETITRFCLTLADLAVLREGWDSEHAFRELFMYYIYRNYFGYVKIRDGLANDSCADCVH